MMLQVDTCMLVLLSSLTWNTKKRHGDLGRCTHNFAFILLDDLYHYDLPVAKWPVGQPIHSTFRRSIGCTSEKRNEKINFAFIQHGTKSHGATAHVQDHVAAARDWIGRREQSCKWTVLHRYYFLRVHFKLH